MSISKKIVKSPSLAVKERKALPAKDRDRGLAYWLGGKSLVIRPIRSELDLIKLSETGVARASVDALAKYIGVTRKVMAEDILGISIKTLERKTPTAKLDRKLSSQVLEIAKLMQHAFEIFEDVEKVRIWFNRENRALGGMKPLGMFDTLTGLNMVNDILGRIEEGVYS